MKRHEVNKRLLEIARRVRVAALEVEAADWEQGKVAFLAGTGKGLADAVLDLLNPPCGMCNVVEYSLASEEEIPTKGKTWVCDHCLTRYRLEAAKLPKIQDGVLLLCTVAGCCGWRESSGEVLCQTHASIYRGLSAEDRARADAHGHGGLKA